MGLSKGSAPQLASLPSGVPPSCLPTSPFQGFVPFPLFPISDEPDSRQPSRAQSPHPRLAVYLGSRLLWLQAWLARGAAHEARHKVAQ